MIAKNWEDCISLRPHTADDMAFMQALYGSTRESELSLSGFSQEQKNNFIEQQFNAQYHHYSQHYCTDNFFIIESSGIPVGRLFIDYWHNEIRIVDITLTPEYRNIGLGSFLFEQLFTEAKEKSLTITIHVENNNPAKNLYERLGFTVKKKVNSIYQLMQWQEHKL